MVIARAAFGALAVAGAAVVGCSRGTGTPRVVTTVPTTPRLSENEVLDLDIEFYKQRADRDPTGATDLARLAGESFEHLRTPRDCMGAVQEA